MATTSAFQTLPAELRNRIYEDVLIISEPIIVARASFAQTEWAAPSLLRACRQVRNEATPIYWSHNTFMLGHRDNLYRLAAWLRLIGREQYQSIRTVHLNGNYFVDEVRATMAIYAYHGSLLYNDVKIALEGLYVLAFVNGRAPAAWVNVPSLHAPHASDASYVGQEAAESAAAQNAMT